MDGLAAVHRSITRLSALTRLAGCGPNRIRAAKPASFTVFFFFVKLGGMWKCSGATNTKAYTILNQFFYNQTF